MFPTITAFGSRGKDGSLGDNVIGGLKEIYNQASSIGSLVSPLGPAQLLFFGGPDQLEIADEELLGAAIVEGASTFLSGAGAGRALAASAGRNLARVARSVPRGSVGALRRAEFDEAVSVQRHIPGVARGNAAAGPINGQAALDVSLQVGANSTRRVGIDYARKEFVIFDEHAPGLFHGHVRRYEELTQKAQAVLRKFGLVDKRGNIIVGD